MAKKQVNVRLGDEAMAALAEVCRGENKTQAEVIESALLGRAVAIQPSVLQSAQLNRMEDSLTEIVEAVRARRRANVA